jgi:hypothetical protein
MAEASVLAPSAECAIPLSHAASANFARESLEITAQGPDGSETFRGWPASCFLRTTETTIGAYAMANDTLINLLAWCKRERERLQMQREMLQSRRFRIFETDESGKRDISNQHVEQITANIAELDRIIAESLADLT